MYNPYLPQQGSEFSSSFPEQEENTHFGSIPEGLSALRGLGSLRELFGKVHLDRLDSGDLLLLLVALLLWREGEEREFAVALGLVLLLELFGDS